MLINAFDYTWFFTKGSIITWPSVSVGVFTTISVSLLFPEFFIASNKPRSLANFLIPLSLIVNLESSVVIVKYNDPEDIGISTPSSLVSS